MALTRNTYQRNSSWNAPYTFSGKEKDVETGYGYFGARYYDSGLSIWLSVDPMSDKYPNMSPYNYCANNPVMLVDPDGREIELNGLIENINKFVQHLNDFIGMDKVFSYNEDSKLLECKDLSNAELDNMTGLQKSAYNIINGMIKDPFKMAINIEASSEKISIGGYYSGSIDIDDVLKIDELTSGPELMGMSLIMHELGEQWYKQTKGKSNKYSGWVASHDLGGVPLENQFTGYQRGDGRGDSNTINVFFEHKSNPNVLINYIIKFEKNNVSSVSKEIIK
jgi:RHS repeat-associated protein